MWPPWGRSSSARSIRRTPSSSHFSFSTFKDIQSLIQEEPKPHQLHQPQIIRKPDTPTLALLHRVRVTSRSLLRSWNSCPIQPELIPPTPSTPNTPPVISLPGTETRMVVYFTSLRIVRKTFQDCKTVRMILRGFRVSIDERDLSMDAGFLEELKQILGVESKDELALPRVFIGGRYIGGAEEVTQLHETGELKKIVEGFPTVEPGVCDHCGGYRFVLCDKCYGSHKVHGEDGGFKACLVCNENGLIRCSECKS